MHPHDMPPFQFLPSPTFGNSSAGILGATSAALAMGSGPPKIEIQKTCREPSNALIAVTENNKQDYDMCMSDEQAAREQLTKDSMRNNRI